MKLLGVVTAIFMYFAAALTGAALGIAFEQGREHKARRPYEEAGAKGCLVVYALHQINTLGVYNLETLLTIRDAIKPCHLYVSGDWPK